MGKRREESKTKSYSCVHNTRYRTPDVWRTEYNRVTHLDKEHLWWQLPDTTKSWMRVPLVMADSGCIDLYLSVLALQ